MIKKVWSESQGNGTYIVYMQIGNGAFQVLAEGVSWTEAQRIMRENDS